ncbi:MAG: GGDEF domain-containing protein [Rubrivivax sp.]|nr:GGDEF domain-containing protein [Rubrivivax sp.]
MVVPAPDLTQLIWLVSCQILLYALGWGLCSVLLREQRDSVAHWAGFMLLVGLGFALISQRGEPRTWGPYVWGNVLFLIGLVALHRGMERFVGTRPADREHLLTLAVGCAGFVWLGPAEDQGAMRVLLAYGSGAWVLSRALFKMLRGLRVEFGLRLTWLLATPPMVVAVLFIVRMSQQLIDLDRRFEMHFLDEGNRLLLYGYLVSAAMFNFAFIGLLTTRFVGRMRQQALHDPLTALPNRRALDNELQKAWQRLRREHRRFALLALDLDRFKAVNDVYGHLAGDSVLQQVAQRLKAAARSMDTVARTGGEEFIVLVPQVDLAGAMAAAERLRASVMAKPFEGPEVSLPMTISVGVAMAGEHDTDLKLVMQRADLALYEAKTSGRNRVCSRLPDAAGSA